MSRNGGNATGFVWFERTSEGLAGVEPRIPFLGAHYRDRPRLTPEGRGHMVFCKNKS